MRALRSRVGRGRRWTVAERARYLREFAESGLSAAAFVRRTGIPRSTFDLWRSEARPGGRRAVRRETAVPARVARVEVLPPTSASGLHLVVRIGAELTAKLRGLDASAAAVIAAMIRERSR